MADDDYYDDYEPSCMEKFQEHFLYCFIPTLCIMFDVGFITVGVICLAKGGDSDFSTCDDAAGDHGRSAFLRPDRRPPLPAAPPAAASARSLPLHLTHRTALEILQRSTRRRWRRGATTRTRSPRRWRASPACARSSRGRASACSCSASSCFCCRASRRTSTGSTTRSRSCALLPPARLRTPLRRCALP